MTMTVTREVRFEFGGDPGDVHALATDLSEWFNESEGLYGKARPRLVAPGADELGPVADAVSIAASSIGIVAALSTWLTERVRTRRVSVRVTRADGAVFELTARDADEVAALEGPLAGFLDQSGAARDADETGRSDDADPSDEGDPSDEVDRPGAADPSAEPGDSDR